MQLFKEILKHAKYRNWDEAFRGLTPVMRQQSVRAADYTQALFNGACKSSVYLNDSNTPEYMDASFMLDGDVTDFELDEDLRYSAIRQDARQAFEWFQRAARHSTSYVEDLVAKGKYLYARCYVDGLGTDFDRDKSVRLMLAAQRSGSPEATAYIIENGITEDMLKATDRKRLIKG